MCPNESFRLENTSVKEVEDVLKNLGFKSKFDNWCYVNNEKSVLEVSVYKISNAETCVLVFFSETEKKTWEKIKLEMSVLGINLVYDFKS